MYVCACQSINVESQSLKNPMCVCVCVDIAKEHNGSFLFSTVKLMEIVVVVVADCFFCCFWLGKIFSLCLFYSLFSSMWIKKKKVCTSQQKNSHTHTHRQTLAMRIFQRMKCMMYIFCSSILHIKWWWWWQHIEELNEQKKNIQREHIQYSRLTKTKWKANNY